MVLFQSPFLLLCLLVRGLGCQRTCLDAAPGLSVALAVALGVVAGFDDVAVLGEPVKHGGGHLCVGEAAWRIQGCDWRHPRLEALGSIVIAHHSIRRCAMKGTGVLKLGYLLPIPLFLASEIQSVFQRAGVASGTGCF